MIELKNIGVRYKDSYNFRRLNYVIPSGAKVVLNAPSGTGKTSFFRLFLGFLQPTEGEVLFDGVKITPNSIKDIRARIGYLSQDVDIPSGKVLEVINEIFSYKNNQNKPLQEDILITLLATLELGADILEKKIDELSGGERQRLLLVILILLDREVYLLDEPTSALDEKLKIKVRELFMNIPATVLVITHDQVWMEAEKATVFNWLGNGGRQDGQ
jgi:putative ABC transport system ATP-binding protein